VILSLLGSGIPLHYDSDYTTIMLDWGLKTKDSGKAQLRNLVLVELRKKARKLEPIDDVQIDATILQQALDILRNDMTITLSKTDREILQQTYTNYRPDDPKQQEFLDLLHNVYVIEYRNAESWYDLHPLVIQQLKLEELI
jgi:hypothetical protein